MRLSAALLQHTYLAGRHLWLSVLLLIGACSGQPADDRQSSDMSTDSASEQAPASERIVTLGGSITEIVYALGAGSMIVATDVSSTWPDSTASLPKIGYQRTLSAENVLSLSPTLIIGGEEAGPPGVIEQLRNSGVRVVIVPSEHSEQGVGAKVMGVADAIGRTAEGRALVDAIGSEMKAAIPAVAQKPPSVMFIYTRGPGALQVSGVKTAADAMIGLSGARNAVTGYEGYKPLTPESAVALAPDVILIPTHGLQQLGGIEALLAVPGIADTPAGRHRRVIAMDDLYLLGFGPRLAKARQELAKRINDALSGEAGADGI